MRTARLKRTIRNALILSTATYMRFWSSKPGKRVIVFHEIKNPSRFREKIQWLREHYEVVPLQALFQHPPGQRTMVAITFDDGYACWYEQAVSVLVQFQIPAVFFVCSGFIGLEGEEAMRFCRERLHRQQRLVPLTREQLLDLAAHPLFEIGSHTVHHVDLGRGRDGEMLEDEIERDRQQLEEWTGKRVRWFAYPFGGVANVSSEAKEYLERASFRAAFTLIPRFLEMGGDKLIVGRDSLDMMEPTWLWSAWLSGGYDGLYTLKSRLQARG